MNKATPILLPTVFHTAVISHFLPLNKSLQTFKTSQMKIYKTQQQAERAAKIEAINQREDRDQKDIRDIDAEMASDRFLIRNKSTQCECGETSAVEVVYFPDGTQGDQFTASAGYCDTCGKD